MVTAAALVAVRSSPDTDGLTLWALTALFASRVAGQLLVAVQRPSWLPPMGDWNFVPYRLLLPVQLVLLGVMSWLAAHEPSAAPTLGRLLVELAFLYWAAIGARYAIRMIRRPDARWLGGTIPIVFHWVLAAFVFALGTAHIAA